MKAVEHNHAVPPEELMAYLDGELEPERALVVHAHLATCGSCEALAAELRQRRATWLFGMCQRRCTCCSHLRVLPARFPSVVSLFAWLFAAPTFQFAGAAAVVVAGLGLLMAIGGGRYARTTVPEAVSRKEYSATDKGLGQLRSTAGQSQATVENRAVAAEAAEGNVQAQPTTPCPTALWCRRDSHPEDHPHR